MAISSMTFSSTISYKILILCFFGGGFERTSISFCKIFLLPWILCKWEVFWILCSFQLFNNFIKQILFEFAARSFSLTVFLDFQIWVCEDCFSHLGFFLFLIGGFKFLLSCLCNLLSNFFHHLLVETI